ncbi:MAG: sodium:proton antiporter, partial [Myxococcales bacterium]|nr:sodium:proton antiporter [Myxococcales bacterium]
KMVPVLLILVAAMSMRLVCEHAGTPNYLAELISDVHTMWVPLASFLVSALVAFMTGSSWATMGIMLPIVVPLAAVDMGPQGVWLLASAAAVLDGAIFGDHCSPISDTTVMSSAAAGCPHDEHVVTQLPYAVTVMVAAAGFGYVGVSLGWWGALTALALASVSLWLFLMLMGRPSVVQQTR